ncbi:hypothetical protein CK203_087772 [Vitis vinifera]|uniref:Uncharacterized protein n=1 Tax=Vitis vinifera TaxID=29760 RepID=A0A438CVB7_VITVI|nr:hypothetical protein CK203_087772 [Vitis vinifera]
MVPAMNWQGTQRGNWRRHWSLNRDGIGKALEIAQSNRWVLSSPPWVSFAMADLLTGSGTDSFRRLFLRFEGDEDLAPVRAISGYRTLADFADLRG